MQTLPRFATLRRGSGYGFCCSCNLCYEHDYFRVGSATTCSLFLFFTPTFGKILDHHNMLSSLKLDRVYRCHCELVFGVFFLQDFITLAQAAVLLLYAGSIQHGACGKTTSFAREYTGCRANNALKLQLILLPSGPDIPPPLTAMTACGE